MRGREFLMKDAYSFDLDKASAIRSYNQMLVSYLRTFERMGLKAVPMRAESGPIGGDYAHEFLILAETGESEVFLDRKLVELTLGDRTIDYGDAAQLQGIFDDWTGSYARTDDTHDEALFHAQVPAARRVTARGIEVGHIFYFGTKYSEPLGAVVTTPDGDKVAVHSGSYGIGVSRLVGAIIEACEALYGDLAAAGLDVLYDDRDERAGAKFATMELIGLPWRITIGPRGLKSGLVELTSRRTGATEELSPQAAVERLAQIYQGI
jgi:prolyl-tRNA synthetase